MRAIDAGGSPGSWRDGLFDKRFWAIVKSEKDVWSPIDYFEIERIEDLCDRSVAANKIVLGLGKGVW